MRKYCIHCFDVLEIAELIKENGELGNCPVCKSKSQFRLNADRIGRFLQCYMDDHYKNRKKEVLQEFGFRRKERAKAAAYLEKMADEEGWQSIEEIMIEDKEIFSNRIEKARQPEILKDLFDASGGQAYDVYDDMFEKRFIPRL